MKLLSQTLAILGSGCPSNEGFSNPSRNGCNAMQRIRAKSHQCAALAWRDVDQVRRAYFQIATVIALCIGQLQAQRDLARLLSGIVAVAAVVDMPVEIASF